jgi:hypothetical protein
VILSNYKDYSVAIPKRFVFLKHALLSTSEFVIIATVNLDNMQFYNHTFTTPVFRRRGFALLSVDPLPAATSCFNKGSATLEPYKDSDSTTSDSENSSFLPVEEVIHRVLHKEYSIAKPWSKLTDSIGKSQGKQNEIAPQLND